MGKAQGGKGGGKGGGKLGEWTERVDPAEVRFTHSKIRPIFSDGRMVEATLQEMVDGKLLPDQLRSITVIRADAYLVSMNNRRLWVLKEARKRGLLKDNTVEVRMQAAQDTKRLKDRFTADKCVLAATFMREPARKAPAEAAALGVEDVWEKDDSEAEEAGERQT